MATSIVPIVVVALLTVTTTGARVLPKMTILEEPTGSYDYPDFSAIYQEYPVATKRAALLFDRLMLALQKAVDDQEVGDTQGERHVLHGKPQIPNSNIGVIRSGSSKTGMDLQRRGHVNGSVYWRCYFNAVTCFKKK